MALVSDRCICLRKHEYSETSQILTLLSRAHGIVRVLAKGAHRTTKAGASKFDGGIDLLDLGEAMFTGDTSRDLATLTEWKLRDGQLTLRRNLRALYLALYSVEIVSLLFQEHDAHPEVFDRLQRILTELATRRLEEEFLGFQLDLLRDAGFMPELGICVSCGKRAGEGGVVYFMASRGGVVCRNCEGAEPGRVELDVRLLRLIQMIQAPGANGVARRLPILSRHQTDPLNLLLAQHLEHTLGRRLKLAYYVIERRTSPLIPDRLATATARW